MAQLIRTAGASLKWIWSHSIPFGDACWAALADGACPELEFLWVDSVSTKRKDVEGTWLGRTLADPAAVRRALGPGSYLAKSLKFCCVNPDEKQKTRYVMGGKGKQADRLDGKKMKEIVYTDYW
jgi:hypothetical protein